MHATLICPDQRPDVSVLALSQPLPLVPILGRTLLDRCLEALAEQGVKSVTLKVADRPDRVREAVGNGERWGLLVTVESEASEPDVGPGQQPLTSLPPGAGSDWFSSYAAWFHGLWGGAPAAAPRTPGAREHAPGVWVGRHCRIAPDVVFEAPVWIGDHVSVGAGVRLGPRVVVESGAMVDGGAEVAESVVGPGTYLGEGTELLRGLAWGHHLVNWSTGVSSVVPDPVLLGHVDARSGRPESGSWTGRLVAAAVGLLSGPLCLPAVVRSLIRGQSPLVFREAVVPGGGPPHAQTLRYAELRNAGPWLRRWPQLWNIVRGQFHWVGNPPLTRAEAASLQEEYEQLWLTVPTGLLSLADAMDCNDPIGDEARAHASGYAAQRSPRFDRMIIKSIFARAIHAGPR